jgi:outer membrane protein assembly factor BamD
MKTHWVIFGMCCALWGCKALQGQDAGDPDYAADAETNLKLGNEELESKNYTVAEKYFEYVRSKFPFLEASREAALKLADTEFAAERYVEARDRYQNFVKLHPTHPKVDYAAYRAALTHQKEMPSDFFLLPPSNEKDQSAIRQTVSAMSEFLRQYPNSSYAPEAKKTLDDAQKRLARHEIYVASFYRRRHRWLAVVGRLETVAEKYPGLGFDEEALMGLHDAYLHLKDAPRAQDALKRLIERMPNTPAAQKAQKLLGS